MNVIKRLSILLIIFIIITSLPVFAQSNSVTVNFNGSALKDKGILDSGRTFIPIRSLFEEGKSKVSWDDKSKVATIETGDDVIKFDTKNNIGYFNDIHMTLQETGGPDTIKLYGDKTYVQARVLSYILGYQIKWDGSKNTVNIDGTKNNKIGFKEAYDILYTKIGKILDVRDKITYCPYENYAYGNEELSENYYIYNIDYREIGWGDFNYAVNKTNGKVYVFYPGEKENTVKVEEYGEFY